MTAQPGLVQDAL